MKSIVATSMTNRYVLHGLQLTIFTGRTTPASATGACVGTSTASIHTPGTTYCCKGTRALYISCISVKYIQECYRPSLQREPFQPEEHVQTLGAEHLPCTQLGRQIAEIIRKKIRDCGSMS